MSSTDSLFISTKNIKNLENFDSFNQKKRINR